MKTKIIDEIIGWYGAIALIAAYGLNSFNILHADEVGYQILNITGAIGIIYISLKKQAYQPVALNLVWTVIGLIAIVRLFLH